MLSLAETLLLVRIGTGALLLLQTAELIAIRASFSESGIWRWSVIREEFSTAPQLVRLALDRMLSDRAFLILLVLRLLGSCVLPVYPHVVLVVALLLSTLLISVRWRGSFNGGSDSMAIVLLSGITLSSAWPDAVTAQLACLWYIALQCCSSYFVSGVVKLQQREWRRGETLARLFDLPRYEGQGVRRFLISHPRLGQIACWSIIAFECSFPVALQGERVCLCYIVMALGFHLANLALFGLNRFLFAWGATYPALLFCSL